MSDAINRRTALGLTAMGVLASRVEAAQHAMHQAQTSVAPWKQQFFTPAEFQELDAVCEAILPGARAAKVAGYIDLIAFHSTPEAQARWRTGLQAFLSLKTPDLPPLLDRLNAGDGPAGAVQFFRDARQATVFAYYSSKPGLIDELGYKGNVAISGFPGCDSLAGQWVTARTSRIGWMTSSPSPSVKAAITSLAPRWAGSRVVRLRVFAPRDAVRTQLEKELAAQFTRLKIDDAPAVTIVPVAGSTVLVEATLEGPKDLNPNGLALVSGQPVNAEGEGGSIVDLVKQSLDKLDIAHKAVGATAASVLRLTCFCSSAKGMAEARAQIRSRYSSADIGLVQIAALPGRTMVEAESAVRCGRKPVSRLELVNPDGLDKSPNYSQIALFSPGRAVWTGAVYAPATQPKAAFDALRQRLLDAGASVKDVGMSCLYPATQAGSDAIRATRFDYYDRSRPPGSTLLLFGGETGEFAVDVVAPVA